MKIPTMKQYTIAIPNLLAIAMMCAVSSLHAATYFSKGATADPTVLASWTNSANASPANFTSGDTFVVLNGATFTAANAWTVSGGATVQINSGGALALGNSTTGRLLSLGGSLVNNGTLSGSTSSATAGGVTFTTDGTYSGSGTITAASKITWIVNSGVKMTLGSGLTYLAGSARTFTVNGTIDCGTNVLTGNSSLTFSLASGGSLITANTGGINGSLSGFSSPSLNASASYILNGTTAQVTAGLPVTVASLTITNSAGVTLSAATTTTNLTLNSGQLTTTAVNLLTIPSAGSIAGTNFVNGPLAQIYSGTGSKTFAIGKGGNQRNVTLNYAALTGTSTVTIEQIESSMGGTLPANTTQFANRYWTVAQSGGSAFTYSLTLDGTGFSPSATAVMLQQGSPDSSYSTTFASPNYAALSIASTGNFTLGNFTPGADKIAFITSAQTNVAGVLSGTITVQIQNSGGTPITYATNLIVNLSSSSGTGAFRDTGDTTTITSVTITSGASTSSFKYKDTAASSTPTLTANGGGLSSAAQTETITPAAANRLIFSTQPANASVNATLAAVVIQLQDAFSNNVAQSGTAVTFALNGASLTSGTTTQSTDASGKATFNDLVIGTAASGLNFTATSTGLTLATSANFNIIRSVITKANNNTALNVSTSWTGGVFPGSDTIASWDNSSVSASLHAPDVGGSTNWYGIQINTWTASTGYTISDTAGTNVITLGLGGITTPTNASHSFALNVGVAFAGNQNWTWVQSGTSKLTLGGPINNSGYPLVIGGSGPVILSGAMSGGGNFISAVTNALTLSGTNTYSGTTVVSNGTLLVSGIIGTNTFTVLSNAMVAGSGTIGGNATFAAGALALFTNGVALTISGSLTLNNNAVHLSLPANLIAGTYTLATYASSGSSGSFNATPVIDSGSLIPGASTVVTTASGVVSLTINKATPTISTNPSVSTITYGQALNALILSGGSVTNAAGAAVPGTFAYTTPSSIPNAGSTSQSVTFTPTDSTNYNTAVTTINVTVNPAALAITANNTSKVYDGVAFSGGNGVTYAGFVNGETNTVLGGMLSYSGTSQGATNVGSYTILPTGLTSANYTITYTNGALSITPVSLTITAKNKTKSYDGVAYSGGNGVTYAGFVNGETNTVLGGTLSYSGTSQGATNAGSYTIIPSGLTSANYAISFANGALSIAPVSLTITAKNNTKSYDGVAFSGGNGVTYAGFVNGETNTVLGGTLSYSGTSQGATNVGSYTIVPSGLTSANYSISYINGTLTITPAGLTVTASSASKVYGQTLSFAGTEFTTGGLTNGDSVSSVTLASSGATNSATVGSYPIVASAVTGSGLANYTISYVSGALTVTAATPVTINSPVRLNDGNLQLTFTGAEAGVSYQIQASTNLSTINWTTLTTNVAATNGLPSFTDLDATNHTIRFYRTVTP